MNKIILILKGLLLYTTMLASVVCICGIDAIYDNNYLFSAMCIMALLYYLCYTFISEKDLYKILGQ